MRAVLFIGLTDYDLEKEDPILEQKMRGLAKDFDVHILARGRGKEREKYGAHFYLMPKRFGRLSPIFFGVRAFFLGRRLIKSQKIEVLVAQSPAVEGLVAVMLGRLTGAKVVVEVHGDWIEGPFYYYHVPLSGVLKWCLRVVGRFTLRRANTVRVVSEFLREMVRVLAPKAKVVKFIAFTPVNDLLEEKDISWTPTVVFLGSLYCVKGVDVLIDACIKVAEKLPDVRLEILGKGPEREALERRARPLGARVRFHGHVPIKDILKTAGVLVLPSRSEGLGRVLVEAAALSKPLVGSRVGGIPEVIKDGENGFTVPPEDVDALSQAIAEVLKDEERAKEMGERGRELIRREFTTEKFFSGYREMINGLQ